jgi:hypothetical protein
MPSSPARTGSSAVRIRIAGVVISDDVEAADVDVEVNVALFEIRRVGDPDLRLRVSRPDRSPSLATDAAAQFVGAHEEEVERVPLRLGIDRNHSPADPSGVLEDPVNDSVRRREGSGKSSSDGLGLRRLIRTFRLRRPRRHPEGPFGSVVGPPRSQCPASRDPVWVRFSWLFSIIAAAKEIAFAGRCSNRVSHDVTVSAAR